MGNQMPFLFSLLDETKGVRMVTEKHICVLATRLREAGFADIALAMEMALFGEPDGLDDLGENEAIASADVEDKEPMSLGSLLLDIPRISAETKSKYQVIASSLLANNDPSVRESARKLLRALK